MRRDQRVELHLCHQRETELTALGQCQAAAPSGLAIAAAQLDQYRHNCAFDEHQRQGEANNQEAVVQEQLQVDEHADADEKKTQQDVAKRPYVGLDLVSVMAFTQQHARQERAERRGQPQQVGQPGRD